MKTQKYLLLICLLSLLLMAARPARPLLATSAIYRDSLGSGWENWSWSANIDLSSSAVYHTGSRSIAVQYTGGWAGFSIANQGGMSTSGYTHLSFFAHGGSQGGQTFNLAVETPQGKGSEIHPAALKANTWSEIRVPLSDLGAANNTITRINLQENSGSARPVFYLDDITLTTVEHADRPRMENGYFHPRAVPADGSTPFIVRLRVTDPQGAGDIASVTLDASALGRGKVALKDDGRSNDGGQGDGVYGAAVTVAPGTPIREVNLNVTATDRGNHTEVFPVGTLTVLSGPGGQIPSVLPQYLGWGSNAWTGDGAENWQPNSGVPWSYLYQYITYGWEGWGGSFVNRFVNHAWNNNYVPVVTVYMLYGSPPACGEGADCYLSKLGNAGAINDFLATLQRAANEAKGSKPVIFALEPDFYGFMQQYTNGNPTPSGVRKDDPTSIPVALNRSGYPNNLAGFGQYMVDTIHNTAPNALVAPMASVWATNGDPHSVSAAEAVEMGKRTANFIQAMGGDKSDLLIVEWSDRDAGFGLRPWWDGADRSLPRPTRALLWENALSTTAKKRLLLWQMPVGNMDQNNTCEHYQDNRAAYAFNHPRELFDTGIIGVLFGAGDGCQTKVWTDGGFVKSQGKIAYDPPQTPTGLAAAGFSGPTYHFRWNENTDPDLWGYQLTYRRADSSSGQTIRVGRRNTASILFPSTGDWVISITAYDAMGKLSPASSALKIYVTDSADLIFLPAITKP